MTIYIRYIKYNNRPYTVIPNIFSEYESDIMFIISDSFSKYTVFYIYQL